MAVPLALPLGERAVLDADPARGAPRSRATTATTTRCWRWIGDARIVLLGEATHGTHEFYRERARITKRLIAREGLHRRRGRGRLARRLPRQPLRPRRAATTGDAEEALRGFQRFPDLDVAQRRRARLRRLAARPQRRAAPQRRARSASTGSTSTASHASMEAVIALPRRAATRTPRPARARATSASSPTAATAPATATRVLLGVSEPCRRAVIEQLVELRRQRAASTCARRARRRGRVLLRRAERAPWSPNAEEYYRTMFGGRAGSWNLRDRHMADTLDQLLAHLDRHGGTDPRRRLGAQLAPRRCARDRDGRARRAEPRPAGARAPWPRRRQRRLHHLRRHRHRRLRLGRAAERKRVRRALPGSYEALFHASRHPRVPAVPAAGGRAADALREPRLERAIGVIYRPETERQSHYFAAERRAPVRRGGPHRPHPRRRAARAQPQPGSAASRPRPSRPRSDAVAGCRLHLETTRTREGGFR